MNNFRRIIQDEFYSIIFRKKIITSLEVLQSGLDEWLEWYNKERTHSGSYCYGKTPRETFQASKHLAHEKRSVRFRGGLLKLLPLSSTLKQPARGVGKRGWFTWADKIRNMVYKND